LDDRQHCSPLILTDDKSMGQLLYNIPIGSPPFQEERLQNLLADHPELLPINEIEPAFGPLIFLGREVPCKSGSIDLLFTNPSGYLTIVETKLWSNPEARRQVVAQVVDYATALCNWSFDDFQSAIREATKKSAFNAQNALENLLNDEGLVEKSSFIDAVSRNLVRGNFLLLIVGNGIREGVESITNYMQKSPGLHFALALVEMNIYSLKPGLDYPLYIQPRTLARTVELVRAVVDVKAPPGFSVNVEMPSEDDIKKGKSRRRLTEQVFFDELADHSSLELTEQLKDLMQSLYDLGLVSNWGSSSVSMRFPDPGGSGYKFTVIVFTTSGNAYTGWNDRISWPEYGGYNIEIASNYVECLYSIAEKKDKNYIRGDNVPIRALLEFKEEYLDCVRRFTLPITKAADEKKDNL